MLVEMNIYHWLRWWWQLKSKQTPKLQIARLRSVPAPTTMWPRRERRPRCRVRDDRQPRVLPQVRLKTYQHTIWIAPDAKSRKMGKIEATLPKTDVLPFLSQDVRPPFTYAALIRQVDRPNSKPIFFPNSPPETSFFQISSYCRQSMSLGVGSLHWMRFIIGFR